MESQTKKLELSIKIVLKELGVGEEIAVAIDVPPDSSHGDYSTNLAFQLSKILKKSPIEIAKEICLKLSAQNSDYKAQPLNGFINFWISDKFLIENVKKITENPKDFGKTDLMQGKKVVVEFTDPNPFKEFHIGHVYTNTVGESLSRIFEANGATVWRADYFGDVGMHVAKAIWGLLHSDIKNPDNKEIVYQENLEKLMEYSDQILEFLNDKTLNQRIKFMGQAYALGSTAYEESDRAKGDVKHLNKLIYIAAQKMWEKEKGLKTQIDYQKGEEINSKELDMVYKLYTTGRSWSLEYFDSLYSRLGMKFDGYYPESIAGEKGYALVKEHINDGIFEENDGAIIFKGGNYGLHTRVFINSLGLPTYEAKELGLAPWKYEDFQYDKSIIVTGSEIREYFKVLIAAMLAVEPDLGKKTIHLPHGMVRLPEGKMSSRTGKIITGEWLMDEAKSRLIKQERKGENPEEIAEKVAIGAIKFAFLKSGIGKDIEFDFDTSLSFEGASGPYIQYSYVRTQSILEKVKKEDSKNKNFSQTETSANEDELLLLRKMYQYNDVIAKAGEKYAPNMICEYLFELSQLFSSFYQKNRIIDVQDKKTRDFRLLITEAIGVILEHGLSLLGIVAPKIM